MSSNINFKIFEHKDLEKVRNWRNSDLIQSVSINKTHITRESQEQWFEGIRNKKDQFHWIIVFKNEHIGYAAIRDVNLLKGECEFSSLYIGEQQYIASGIGAIIEFELLNMIFNKYHDIKNLYCQVLNVNQKVIQLHRKFGFEIENITDNPEVTSLRLSRLNWNNKVDRLKKILKV